MKSILSTVRHSSRFGLLRSWAFSFISVNKMSSNASVMEKVTENESDKSRNRCVLFPPSIVRGMKVLDRDKFCKIITVPCVIVNEGRLGHIMKGIRKFLLKIDNFKPVQLLEPATQNSSTETSKSALKKIILDPKIVNSFDDIKEVMQNFNISVDSFQFGNLELTYTNWKADELLKAVLPDDKDSLTSYSIIGHIVHINLRDHLLDYKHVIGQILLDKVKGAKTVVNKIDMIDNIYRNFKMEVLCGENNMMVQVRENYCTFEFDFSLVYWNPRLSTEHERISSKVKYGDIMYDIFAGVGPFAIPAARRKCTVLANDLNPESYKWLQHNAKLNKTNQLLHSFNKDGGDFIKENVRNDMLQRWQNSDYENSTMHIVMNLPSMAVTFLKFFRGLFTHEELEILDKRTLPVVHVYCFTKGDDPSGLVKQMVEENLGAELADNLVEIFHVRNVSVKKEMMRVTFLLSRNILIKEQCKTSRKCTEEFSDKSDIKRICFGENGEDHHKNIFM